MTRRIAILFALIVAVAVPAAVFGQAGGGYDLGWSHLPGGGGRSTGAGIELLGAVGQPVVGSSSGGGYTVDSGFFAGAPVRYRLVLPLVASDR
jgi:hypothetical protein